MLREKEVVAVAGVVVVVVECSVIVTFGVVLDCRLSFFTRRSVTEA